MELLFWLDTSILTNLKSFLNAIFLHLLSESKNIKKVSNYAALAVVEWIIMNNSGLGKEYPKLLMID